jgi:diguanylate cyclase (GGDEF)-like protein
VRGLLAVWLLGLAAILSSGPTGAADPATAASAAAVAKPGFELRLLSPSAPAPTADNVASGSLDSYFKPFKLREARQRGTAFWVRVQAKDGFVAPAGAGTALIVRKGRHLDVDVWRAFGASDSNSTVANRTAAATDRPSAFDLAPATDRPAAEAQPAGGGRAPAELALAATKPTFGAAHDAIFALPDSLAAGDVFYARVEPRGGGAEILQFTAGTLQDVIRYGAYHSWMITVAFGALMAMAITSLLIWFVLSDRLLIYYSVLFSSQALYVAFFSGQGFDWPLLSWALPLQQHAWNVPVAISGAAACMFVREIADLQRFWPRVYAIFGWFALGFLVLAASNVLSEFGLGGPIAAVGNLMFAVSAVFTLVVAFMAWQKGGRAAGFFLIAWALLEAFTIAAALRLLTTDASDEDFLLHTGLPLSMVVAAVLIALGVADRLREQRRALSEAERRAETDSLTGVLNRRSLIERLEAACMRAQARDMPIALLFIDLDHFKQINDSYGHLAGDACLAGVVAPIQAELRQSDVVGRYGGEEFIVILSSASASAAHMIAERIRERVASVRVEGYGPPIRLTCSIGVAASDTLGVWGKHLIARADEAVYAAKRSGRNCVQMAESLAA